MNAMFVDIIHDMKLQAILCTLYATLALFSARHSTLPRFQIWTKVTVQLVRLLLYSLLFTGQSEAMDEKTMDSISRMVTAISSEASLKTFLLPVATLCSIDYAARYALRTWVAVQSLQDGPAPQSGEDKEVMDKAFRKRKILARLAIALFVIGEVVFIQLASEKAVERLFTVIVAVVLGPAYLILLTRLFGFNVTVYRRSSGDLTYALHKPTKFTKVALLVPIVFSLLFTYLSIRGFKAHENGLGSVLLQLLSTSATIFALISRVGAKRMSLRKLTILFAVYQATVMLLTVVLVFADNLAKSKDKDSDQPPATGALNDDTGLNPLSQNGFPWAALYASPTAVFLAACLRFDYHQATTSISDGSSENSLQLQQVPAQEVSILAFKTGPGLIIPSSSSLASMLPRPQRKYYTLALAVTAATYLTMAPILHYLLEISLFTDKKYSDAWTRRAFENELFGVLTMLLLMPVLVISVFTLAAFRGEAKQLWKYEEVWNKTAKDQQASNESAEESEAGDAEKEKLVNSQLDAPPADEPDTKPLLADVE